MKASLGYIVSLKPAWMSNMSVCIKITKEQSRVEIKTPQDDLKRLPLPRFRATQASVTGISEWIQWGEKSLWERSYRNVVQCLVAAGFMEKTNHLGHRRLLSPPSIPKQPNSTERKTIQEILHMEGFGI